MGKSERKYILEKDVGVTKEVQHPPKPKKKVNESIIMVVTKKLKRIAKKDFVSSYKKILSTHVFLAF